MNPTFDAFVRSWPFEPWLAVLASVDGGCLPRGWLVLHRRDRGRWPRGRLFAFVAGLTVLFLALASPIEPFASLLLQVHMLQHFLLMMVAPPLLWLGAPFFPLLRGLPQPIRTYWVAPLFRVATYSPAVRTLTHPVPALLLFTAATWIWHFPPVYEMRHAQTAGIICSTSVFSAPLSCSGIRSSGRSPAGRGGRAGC